MSYNVVAVIFDCLDPKLGLVIIFKIHVEAVLSNIDKISKYLLTAYSTAVIYLGNILAILRYL